MIQVCKSSIEELRSRHRDSEHQQVIDAVPSVRADEDNPEQLLLYALALLMNGDNEQGRPLLEQALQAKPLSPAWRSDQALANLLLGRAAQASQLLETVVAGASPEAVDYGRLAAVKMTLGDFEAAVELYAEAVNREPGRIHWHHNLSVVFLRLQRLEDALEQLNIALRIEPDNERALSARLNVLSALDRTEEMVTQLEEQLGKDPEDLPTRLQYARALAQDGRLSDAMATLAEPLKPLADLLELKESDAEQFEQQKPTQIQLRASQCELLLQRSRNHAAYIKFREIEQLEPENPLPTRLAIINVLTEMSRYEEAEERMDELLEEYPDSNPAKIAQAYLLNDMGRYQEAEQLLRELIAVYPGDASLLSSLGQTLLWVGELDEAAQCFEKAGEINPMALAQIVKTRKMPENAAALKRMEAIADNRVIGREPRATMSFALAEMYDRKKDYERAFQYLAQANELVDRDLDFSAENFSKRVDANIRIFNKDYFASLSATRGSDRTPIFVVGMPRSGTTLTEQILCSHPDVFGAGELDLLPVLTRLMPGVLKAGKVFPGCMRAMTPQLREEAARYYLFGLQQHDEEKHFVVDKMPHNFMNVGLIAAVLPSAKIIHISRDPRDSGLSNFEQNFKAKDGGMGYAFNLQNIALQINDYTRMMAHWRETLPVPMFELSYEELVEDQQGVTQQLLDFIGVDWDDSVRDFHKTERAVRTASVSQVRQPIYATSKQKWRRYAEQLAPLLNNLSAAALTPWNNSQ